MKNDIILTFDYELYLGKNSGSLLECLEEVTTEILDIFKRHNSTGLFFIDSSCLLFLKENGKNEYEVYCNLIKKIILNGHDIGLHLHPHWLDAKKTNDGNWDLSNYSRYRLHNLEPGFLENYFNKCLTSLQHIVDKERGDYKIKSFRAGGWSITPFDNLKKIFINNDIDMDFSVLPGDFQDQRPKHYYDFRSASLEKWFWRFEDNPSEECINGQFYEIPVTRYKINPLLFLLNKYLHNKTRKSQSGGISASHTSFYNKLLKLFRSIKYASLDDIAIQLEGVMLKRMGDRSVLCFVGHPKGFSRANVRLLDKLLSDHHSMSINEIRARMKNASK